MDGRLSGLKPVQDHDLRCALMPYRRLGSRAETSAGPEHMDAPGRRTLTLLAGSLVRPAGHRRPALRLQGQANPASSA